MASEHQDSEEQSHAAAYSPVFHAQDFGYSFTGSQGQDVQDSKASPQPFRNVKYARMSDLNSSKGGPAGPLGACCCFLTLSVALIIVGTVLANSDFDEQSKGEKAGIILLSIGLFLVVAAMVACCAACGMLCGAPPERALGGQRWSLKRLNDKYENDITKLGNLRYDVLGDAKYVKQARAKEEKRKSKERKELAAKVQEEIKKDLEEGLTLEEVQRKRRPLVFKIVFDGDIYVSSIDELREQVSLCLAAGSKSDTVCVVLSSGGGAVTMYGLAAAQLGRFRKAGMNLVVCVDSIAASGGYMMATVATKIVASPFALVGSIGVISIVPNVQKLLEKYDINTYVFTAGKYKRTVDVIGEVTDEGKAKMVEELEHIHQVFKDHIVANRPALVNTINEVSTGEAWLAVEGKQKGLVDEIMTSDEYLATLAPTHDIIEVSHKSKRKIDEFFDLVMVKVGSFGRGATVTRGPMAV
mmetsp:Transcript_4128/g.7891  ORF Transcript_4128/g.7891 Transcript_4128/m.7891 type:complete len:469 (+) Transcript_4128:301-1707(+)